MSNSFIVTRTSVLTKVKDDLLCRDSTIILCSVAFAAVSSIPPEHFLP